MAVCIVVRYDDLSKRFDFPSIRWVLPFAVLFIFTFPTPPDVLPDPANWLAPVFETLVLWVGDSVLGIECNYSARLISDSTGLWIHGGILVVLSALIAGVWSVLDRKRLLEFTPVLAVSRTEAVFKIRREAPREPSADQRVRWAVPC